MCVKMWAFLKTLNSRTLIQLKLFFPINKNSIFHLCSILAIFSKNNLSERIRHLKKIYGKDEDFEVTRKRKWGECDSDEKLLVLAFLPSLTYCPYKSPVAPPPKKITHYLISLKNMCKGDILPQLPQSCYMTTSNFYENISFNGVIGGGQCLPIDCELKAITFFKS